MVEQITAFEERFESPRTSWDTQPVEVSGRNAATTVRLRLTVNESAGRRGAVAARARRPARVVRLRGRAGQLAGTGEPAARHGPPYAWVTSGCAPDRPRDLTLVSAPARRDGQGRHRQDHRGRRAGAGPRRRRPAHPARGGGAAAGNRPGLRPGSAALRGAADRHRVSGQGVGRRGRGVRPGGRRRGGAAGVPRHVLQARPGREGAAALRRDRLRDDGRSGGTGCPAHGKGQGGRHPDGPGAPGVRRGDPGRAADRPYRPVSQRHGRDGAPGEAGTDQDAERARGGGAALARHLACIWSQCSRRCRSRRPSTPRPNCSA